MVKSIWKNPIHFIACGFGAGALPFAPGTWGTLIAIPLYLVLQPLPLALYISIVGIAGLVGIWLCRVTAQDMGVHDHPSIVWDEIVGYWLTMIAAPAGWMWIWLGFLLFRIFDVWKPWPIRWIDQRIQGGFGIMFDDILAGLYAWICLQSIYFLFYRIF